MIEQWPTEKQDMLAVAEIISKYTGLGGDGSIGIVNVKIHNEREKNPIEVKPSAWVLEMIKYFRERYGYEHGHAVISKVITVLMLKNETIH